MLGSLFKKAAEAVVVGAATSVAKKHGPILARAAKDAVVGGVRTVKTKLGK